MPSNDSKVILACAGSGKTTRLAEEALSKRDRRIAIITYTNSNARKIVRKFGELNSGVPANVEVLTWYCFLMRECARPYQKSLYGRKRIEALCFLNQRSVPGIAEKDVASHYFANGDAVYSDKLAKFIVKCDIASKGLIVKRLSQIFTDIFVDEFQDLAGWDFDIIERLLQSELSLTLVGDPRQHIYQTNVAKKNEQYLGVNVMPLLKKWQRSKLCEVAPQMNGSYRCNQPICDFVNYLWPGMEPMLPLLNERTQHHGVFLVAKKDAARYLDLFGPQELRYRKDVATFSYEAMNFGVTKGLEFDRVMIIPTAPIAKFLRTGNSSDLGNSRDKLHVAVTRARHSVAFVCDGTSPIVPQQFVS